MFKDFPTPEKLQEMDLEYIEKSIMMDAINALIKEYPKQLKFTHGVAYKLPGNQTVTLPHSVIKLNKGEYRVLPQGKNKNSIFAPDAEVWPRSATRLKYGYPLVKDMDGIWRFQKITRAIKIERFDPNQEPERVAIKVNESQILQWVHNKNYGGFLQRVSKKELTKRYDDMPYFPGNELFQIYKSAMTKLKQSIPITKEEVVVIVKIYIASFESLADFHDLGLTHRDVKGENFIINFVDGEFTSKLFDFGFSKLSKNELDATVGGTVHCAAPEQFIQSTEHSGTSRSTPKTDVYAMGVVGFELFGGSRDKIADDQPYVSIFADFCAGYDINPTMVLKLVRFFRKLMADSEEVRPTSREACIYLKEEILDVLEPKSEDQLQKELIDLGIEFDEEVDDAKDDNDNTSEEYSSLGQ